jgi:hypothetical protein
MKLKGHIETVSDIQRELRVICDRIKENDFHIAFETTTEFWVHCICFQRDYFEGDGSQNLVS